MSQTLAILHDAYRRVNDRKVFWSAMALSAAVVAVLAGVSINERGVRVFTWQFDSDVMTSDMVLSRPIGRWRLFLTQYAGGLVFVALQALVFSVACFAVLAWRADVLAPGIFLAVPTVVLVFSYLFSFSVLIGVLTRSTVSALLLTGLFWLLVFGLGVADKALIAGRVRIQHETEKAALRVDRLEQRLQRLLEPPGDVGPGQAEGQGQKEAGAEPPEPEMLTAEQLEFNLRIARDLRDRLGESVDSLRWWNDLFFSIRTFLPKTDETVSLVERWMIPEGRIPRGRRGGEIDRTIRGRSVAWIVGTSVAFELVVLLAGGWLFVRRDY